MNLATRAIKRIRLSVWRICRSHINDKNRKRLSNASATVIASNCIGGIILHDLGLPFLTPTVNLFIPAQDFLRFVADLDRYLAAGEEMVEVRQRIEPYPVGRLIDVDIHFFHYPTFADAKQKWCERCKRVQRENVVLMMTDRDGFTAADVPRFDQLPFAHKVVFTHRPYPERSAFYIRGFESEECVGNIFGPSSTWGRRHVDAFDYVSFLNNARARD